MVEKYPYGMCLIGLYPPEPDIAFGAYVEPDPVVCKPAHHLGRTCSSYAVLHLIQLKNLNCFPYRIGISEFPGMGFKLKAGLTGKTVEFPEILKRLCVLIIIQVDAPEIIKGKERLDQFQYGP